MTNALVQTVETFHTAHCGPVTYLKVYTPDYRRLNWQQVWRAFADVYPDRWAIELYPPAEELVDDAHVYHLWMFPAEWTPPVYMNLAMKYQVG